QLDPANPMFAEGGVPAARAPRPVESDTFAVSSDYKPDTSKVDKGFDMGLDEEISLSPTSGVAPKPMAEAFGDETVVHRAPAPATAGLAAAAAVGAAAGAGSVASRESIAQRVEAARETVADKVKAAADKFDMDFHLDDDEKPAPMRKAEPALAT